MAYIDAAVPSSMISMQNGDEYDEVSHGCFLEEFKEAKEITNIIASLSNIYSDQIAVERALERFQCEQFILMNSFQLFYHQSTSFETMKSRMFMV